MTEKPSNYYIDAEKMSAEIVKHNEAVIKAKEEGREPPRVPHYIGECFYLLAENIALKPNYSGYSDIEDMKQEACINCVRYIHNYQEGKGTAYTYFSRAVENAFINRIRINKKRREKEKEYTKTQGASLLCISGDDTDFQHVVNELVSYGDGVEEKTDLTHLDYAGKFARENPEKLKRKRKKKDLK